MIKPRGRDGALLTAGGRRRDWERLVEFHLLSPHRELNRPPQKVAYVGA